MRVGGGDGADHVGGALFELVEDGLDAGLLDAGLVAVDEGVVGVVLVAQVVGGPALEIQEPLQVGEEDAEIVGGARLFPGRLGERCGAGDGGDEVRGKFCGAFVSAAGEADDGGVVRPGFGVAGAVEEAGRLLGGDDLVGEAGEGGEKFGAARGAARGHVRLLVPEQDRGGRVQVAGGRQVVYERAYTFVRFHEGGR